jgi:hypothetical protein
MTIACELSGKYIGISIPGPNNYLSLCEVEAFEGYPLQFTAVSVSQSSNPYGDMGKASNAINGNKYCTWVWGATNSLTCTD